MKISIVTISFNQATFVARAIDSVLTQGVPNLEYIVVDPGSADGSRAIVDGYGARIAARVYEPDAGPADGLNAGFARASGEVFGFLNADDELLPGALDYVSRYFEAHPDVDVLMGSGVWIDEAGAVLRRVVPSRFTVFAFAFERAEFIQQAVFFRASAFRRCGGFNVANRVSWDGELLLAMRMAGVRFQRSACELGAFRVRAGSITGDRRYRERLAGEHRRLFELATGRARREPLDAIVSVLALVWKWAADPWYVALRVSRNARALRAGAPAGAGA